MSQAIRIVEVGPRDGLQNIPTPLSLEMKKRMVQGLMRSGLKEIEIASFVSPKWVPQMEGSLKLACDLSEEDCKFWGLVPNQRGYEDYLKSPLTHIALFSAVSDSFNKKNTNKTFHEALEAQKPIAQNAKERGHKVRLYLSTVFVCPYEESMSDERIIEVYEALKDFPFDDLSLGDTIGKASPRRVKEVSALSARYFDLSRVSYHFHDTYGMGLCNVAQAIEDGVTSFDTSAAGLGGCPYAPGASGNLATEDLVYFLESQGVKTGILLEELIEASREIHEFLGIQSASKVNRTLGAKK